jgi:hypothetical protein
LSQSESAETGFDKRKLVLPETSGCQHFI